ncbi:hypothetical protein [Mesorhizobium jarvisii]|uniref:hypothetical protein n=1 Tax=Mesorhizobium jarvisii TaxID=1777867 RepID=UPI001F0B6728|nr:hypothetical protein [Mesorhizobium jarvisii]MCH4560320.1 hypothetical protein [Mesorhizobium jarvisii]
MTEIAGNVTVQISGNIAPFEAALAKAQQMATTFDAQISAKLNGAGVSEGLAKIAAGVDQTNALLAKLTTSGTAASAVMSKIATSTTATTAALSQVATATKLVNAEMNSIGGSGGGAAALTAGTIAAKDFAAALEATGGNLGKITPQMLGLAAANQEVGASGKAAAVGMAELGVAETKAAGLGAGVTREFSVLGAEIARGNFSRIPGSLIVLNERLVSTGAGVLTLRNGLTALGGLASAVFNPFTLGFLAISIGSEVAIKAFSGMKGSILDVNTVLENNKKLIDEIAKAYPEAAVAAKQYEEQANQIPKSVAAADLKNQIDEARKTLAADLNTLRIDMHALGGEFALTGKAGSEAFEALSGRVHDGTISAQALYSEIGRLELDPKLSDEAHAFARSLEDAAKKAADLEKSIQADTGINTIIQDNAKAQHTLFELSAGLKDVGASASSADATIAKLFGTMNSGGSEFGVTRSLAGQFGSQLSGQLQTTLGMFEQVDAAVQNARQNQLAGMVQLEAQFRSTTERVDVLKQAIATSAGADNIKAFFGDVAGIKDANAEIANATTTVNKLFAAMASGNTSVNAVYHGLDMVRQTLINDGFPVEKVNNFVDSLVRTNQELVADTGAAHQLNAAIQAIQNKTVTITVVTKQVGSGKQSIYDVPGGPVGVTRYGSGSAPSMTAYEVPSSAGGMVDTSLGGSSTVGVTRYSSTKYVNYVPYTDPNTGTTGYMPPGYDPAANNNHFSWAFATGGMIHPGDSQQVSFFKSPDETVGIFTPGQMSALASPQSGFTGRDPTKDNERYWTVLMNIEANTRKTEQLLDEINTSSRSSGLGSGSSSGAMTRIGSGLYDSNGLNAAGHTAEQVAAYSRVLSSAMANYSAIGGMGLVGYGSNGLAATPRQIADNLVYGGGQSVGIPSGGSSTGPSAPTALHGGDPYNSMLNGLTPGTAQYAQVYAQALAASNKAKGFATGGIDSSDTQKVEFFKSPGEKVIIARPDQFADVRPGTSSTSTSTGGDMRPIQVHAPIYVQSGAQVSKDSLAAMRRELAAAVRDGLRSVNGR